CRRAAPNGPSRAAASPNCWAGRDSLTPSPWRSRPSRTWPRTGNRIRRTPSNRRRVTIHPPKHETFDLSARTNTDPKGIVRAVDEYRLMPWGLYMARPTPGRAQFHYLETWLLPSLGLRAN